jgi:hypothetical protein
MASICSVSPATKGSWDNAFGVEFSNYPAHTMIADAESGTDFVLRESFSGEPYDQDFSRGCLIGHQDLINGM